MIEQPRAQQPPIPAIDFPAESLPRSGVEILSYEERDGMRFYIVRDLRNKSIVRNVTQKSARDLWLYAINQHTADVYDVEQIPWQNDRAILSRSQRAGKVRYDLAIRDNGGKVHIFYGVADDAMDNRWRDLIQATMPPLADETAATDSTPPAAYEPAAQAPGQVDNGVAIAVDSRLEPVDSAAAPVAETQVVADNPGISNTQTYIDG